jgi:hypothetical protein
VQDPDEDDWKKLMRVLKYLNYTKHMGLRFSGTEIKGKCSIDAAYAVHKDARSHSGLVKMVANGVVGGKSSKQKLVTKSSTEAEVVALSDGAGSAVAMGYFLAAQGYANHGPVIVEQDNQACLAMMEKGRSTSEKTRHIDIRYFFTKDRVDAGELKLVYVPTEDLVADIMTKPLQGALFVKLRNKLQNWYD